MINKQKVFLSLRLPSFFSQCFYTVYASPNLILGGIEDIELVYWLRTFFRDKESNLSLLFQPQQQQEDEIILLLGRLIWFATQSRG